MSAIRILGIGDIVGGPGRRILRERLSDLAREKQVDFIVANAENATGGSGIRPEHAAQMLDGGIDVLTGGDHIWRKKEIIPFIQNNSRLLRPANYPDSNPGVGHTLIERPFGKVGVIHVVGRIFMMSAQAACPFETTRRLAEELRKETPIIVVDVHAEATSEKIAFGWYLDGRVSYIFGTHTHIPTADERLLPKGTAYITDVGMTGPYESVIGRKVEPVLQKMVTQMPAYFEVAEGDVRLYGAIATVDTETGKATAIERVSLFEPAKKDSAAGT